MPFRKLVFWLHLTAGCLAGVVILAMCVTGVILAYQRQIISLSEHRYRVSPPPSAAKFPIERVLERLEGVQAGWPMTVTWRSDLTVPLEINFGREKTLLVNPYTGEIFGEGAAGLRRFFHTAEDAHRWLAFGPANRAAGRAITGACNLIFFILVCTGPYLWLPRRISSSSLKTGLRFNGSLSGKAREFNWHNVIGIWCFLPLMLIVLCALVMSYAWANNLVYRVTGNTPPPPPSAWLTTTVGPIGPAASSRANWDGLDALLLRAEQKVPEWRTVTLRLTSPADPNATFTIDWGSGGRPDQRAQITFERKTPVQTRWEPFSSYNSGRRLRAWIRFTHTGEAGGIAGQTVAALVTLGAVFLVYTGLRLAVLRFATK